MLVVDDADPRRHATRRRRVKIGLSLLLALDHRAGRARARGARRRASLLLIAAREFLVGFALALAVRVLLAAAELGGYLVGFQIGFSYAGIVDPQSGVRNNVLAIALREHHAR